MILTMRSNSQLLAALDTEPATSAGPEASEGTALTFVDADDTFGVCGLDGTCH